MKLYKKLMTSALWLVFAGAASAQVVSVSNTTTTINTLDHVATVTIAQGTGPASLGSVDFNLSYTNAQLALPTGGDPIGGTNHPEITPSDSDVICVVNTVGTVACSGFGAIPLPFTVQIRFDAQGTPVPAPGSPLTLSGVALANAGGATLTPESITNGSVIIDSAPPNVTLSFTPAPGATVTFPGGTAFTTSNTSIAVAAGGTLGSGTVTGCTITGAGAAAFGTPPADITVAAGASGSLPLSCTLPNTGGAATATLTCTETDSNTPAPGAARTWPLSCPQGTPVPGPGFGASPAPNPAPAAPILCNGQAGDSVQRQITITNNGNAGAGSALDFTCTGGGIVSIVSGGTATGLAVGASQTVTVACAVPGDGVTSTGTVSCTSNAPGAPFVFNYSSTGSTFPPPVPRPAVVPASSTWSQIALIALLAGLGLAFVGFRRGQ